MKKKYKLKNWVVYSMFYGELIMVLILLSIY